MKSSILGQKKWRALRKAATRGELKSFTGIDDPYELPKRPDIRLETVSTGPEINARLILEYLLQKGFVKQEGE